MALDPAELEVSPVVESRSVVVVLLLRAMAARCWCCLRCHANDGSMSNVLDDYSTIKILLVRIFPVYFTFGTRPIWEQNPNGKELGQQLGLQL
jgi:hypothetical protein